MKMNQSDIEIMASNTHDCPNVRKAVRLLAALLEAVNAQSDGWAHWAAPSRAAEPLMDLLRGVGNIWHDTHGTISDSELRKAITPIKAMVTNQKRIQAAHGNKFEFDVEAALAENAGCAESEAQHTPLPWYKSRQNDPRDQGLVISEATGANVAVTYYGQADAEFIIRACNAHDELLAACKRLASRLQSHLASVESCDVPASDELALDEAQTAIAKAESK